MSGKLLVGAVVKKTPKTVKVLVKRQSKDPLYGKRVVFGKKYAVHDEEDRYQEGDIVTIRQSRPISKTKKWVVVGLSSE